MNRLYALLLVVIAAAAALCVYLPLHLLRPMEPQTAGEVAAAYAAARWSPLVTLVLLGAGAVLLALIWKRSSWWLRAPAALLVAVIAVTSYAARLNPFLRFFAPLAENRFVSVAEAGLEDEDMVLGVVVDGEARAYPVGLLAYHHVVNDAIAGEPLVVTY